MSASVSENSAAPAELISCTIDGVEIHVPQGTLIIRAAEQIGIEIPRFCDHPLLSPVAACRMCLVEIEGQAKPQPACAIPVGDKMVVKTQLTSEVADLAQRGVMEFLLINHPLDCPICDKGGECPLQNQAMTHGNGESRFHGIKRTFPKPIPVSAQILLDRERCVSCARCTRFADEIAGDPYIELLERGAQQQVGIADDRPFDSYFSGNTVQICPVGALTSADYRFRSRPFDLVSTPTVCDHCASGCALRTDHRRDTVMRRLAWDDPAVNEEWNCDKGRFAFTWQQNDRITAPMLRTADDDLRAVSWPEAIEKTAELLAAHRGTTAVLTGGRLTREDAYAYSKFARAVMASDHVDFRTRRTTAEEEQFLHSLVAGKDLDVTYQDLESAPVTVLLGLEPEEESPIIFLRLRKAVLAGKTTVAAVSTWASPGFVKAGGTVLAAGPGQEVAVITALSEVGPDSDSEVGRIGALLAQPGSVILVGERLADSPGALSAAAKLAQETGARLAWVPRRIGDRGAVDAGLLPGLLPGARALVDPDARAQVAHSWGVDESVLPSEPGHNLEAIIAALTQPAADDPGSESAEVLEPSESPEQSDPAEQPGAGSEDGEAPAPAITAVILAGVDIDDLPDPAAARLALAEADVVISLETRLSQVAEFADVILPVAVDIERAGSYSNWEGRVRTFPKVVRDSLTLTDGRILAMIADALDVEFGYGDSASLRRELVALGAHEESRPAPPSVAADAVSEPGAGEAILSTWRQLLDDGLAQRPEKYLAGTQRRAVARLSPQTAAAHGLSEGEPVRLSTDRGAIELPVVVTDMPDGYVWVPGYSEGSHVHATLAATSGTRVAISAVGGE